MSGDFFFPWDSSCWLPFYDNSETAQSRRGTEKEANHLKLTTELTGNRFKTFLKTLNTYLLGLVFIKLTESVGAGGSAVCAACPACRVCRRPGNGFLPAFVSPRTEKKILFR